MHVSDVPRLDPCPSYINICHIHADESQIQRALQELVGRDTEMLKGCFLVDQLVFQETCHQLF